MPLTPYSVGQVLRDVSNYTEQLRELETQMRLWTGIVVNLHLQMEVLKTLINLYRTINHQLYGRHRQTLKILKAFSVFACRTLVTFTTKYDEKLELRRRRLQMVQEQRGVFPLRDITNRAEFNRNN